MTNERIFEAFMSFLVPGLGQLLQGRTGRGIGFFFGSILLAPILIGIVLYVYGIVDAYRFEE